MSRILSIEELRKEMLGVENVEQFMHKQQELLERYMRENEQLKKELNDYKNGNNSSLMINDINHEELICVEQIRILRERSSKQELDINDVKKLDILIKNLNLIRSKPTDMIDVSSRDVTQEELLAIAVGQSK